MSLRAYCTPHLKASEPLCFMLFQSLVAVIPRLQIMVSTHSGIRAHTKKGFPRAAVRLPTFDKSTTRRLIARAPSISACMAFQLLAVCRRKDCLINVAAA